MKYSKLCSIVVAVLMVATIFAVPVSAPSDAAAADEPEEKLMNGSYGFEITMDDLKACEDKITELISTFDIPDVPKAGDDVAADPAVPNIFEDNEALKDVYSKLMASMGATKAEVTEGSADLDMYLAGALTVTEVAEGETPATFTAVIDAAVTLDFSTSFSGKYLSPEGEKLFSASASAGIDAAVSGSAVFTKANDVWMISDVSLQIGIGCDIAIKTHLPFLDTAVTPKSIRVMADADVALSPKFFISAEAVGLDEDGELSVNLIMFNNLLPTVESFLKTLRYTEEEIDSFLEMNEFFDIDTYVNEIEGVAPDAFDPSIFRNLDTDLDALLDTIFSSITAPVEGVGVIEPSMPELTETQKTLIKDIIIQLMGDDGLKLTDAEVDSIKSKTSGVIKDSKAGMSELKHNVTVLAPDAALGPEGGKYKVVKECIVNHGESIPMDDPAIKDAAQDYSAYTFIGWAIVDVETEEDDDGNVEVEYDFETLLITSKVYGSMCIAPVYVRQITGYEYLASPEVSHFMLSTVEDFDTGLLKIGNTLIIDAELDDAEDLISDFTWNFYHSVNDAAWGSSNISTKLTTRSVTSSDFGISEDDEKYFEKAIELDFAHSGALPSNTTVTLDVTDKYAPGTSFQVWHVVDGKLYLVNSGVTVDAYSKLVIPLNHCSSYVLTEGSPVDDILPSGTSSDGNNNNTMIYIGVGVAVIVLIGAAVLIFRRNH